jgi:flavin-dependent dehydrogenase
VAGAGPAGAAAALALAGAGRRVLLAEGEADAPGSPPAFKIGETLPPAVKPLLRDLGVWDGFCADGHLPSYGTRSAWGSSDLAGLDHIFDPNGHGWHLDRARFDRFLRAAARADGVELRDRASVRACSRAPDGLWTLRLGGAGPDEVRCRLVIDATGRRAVVARRLGARRERRDRLVALYGVAAARERDRDSRTLVESAPEGWWYTALIPRRRRVLAFLTDADLVERPWRTQQGFAAALSRTAHVGTSWEAAALEDGPATTAAHGTRLHPVAGDGWLAVGDAALAFDPLSSQGMLTALFTGVEGGRAAHAALAGDASGLAAYRDRVATIAAHYDANRRRFYALEQRWPEAPFWSRRA